MAYTKEQLFEDMSQSLSRPIGGCEKAAASVQYDLISLGFESEAYDSLLVALCESPEDLIDSAESIESLLTVWKKL